MNLTKAEALNRLAETKNLPATQAANALAGTTRLTLDGALNAYAETKNLTATDAANVAAGTKGLTLEGALNELVAQMEE